MRVRHSQFSPRFNRKLSPFQFGRTTLALVVASLTLLPLLYLVGRGVSVFTPLENVLNARTMRVIGQSLAMMGAVMAGTLAIGLPFAWLTSRTDLPFRRFWLIIGLLPMAIPTYLTAITYIAAFGPRGMVYDVIAQWLSIDRLPSIYGFFGTWFTLTFATYPLLVLPVRAALLKTTPVLEEAAADLGANRWRVFWRVILPHCRPSLYSGMIFAGLYSLSDFGAAAIMRYDNFTQVIYLQYTNSFDRHQSAALALVLVVITLILLAVETLISRGYVHPVTGTPYPPTPIRLAKWRVPALLFCASLVFFGVIVPLLMIMYWLMTKTGTRLVETTNLTLTVNTLGVSAITAGLVAIVGLLLTEQGKLSAGAFRHWLMRLPYLGYALPGIVIGLALVFFTTRYFLPLYQTLPVLITAYLIRFLPLTLNATRHAVGQITPRIIESAHALGASERQIVMRITLPLARTGILGGATLVFLGVMKELPITLMLAPTGFYTLPYRVWSSYQEAIFSQIGLPALLLLLTAPLAITFIMREEES